MEPPTAALRAWYQYLRTQRLCVRCQTPVATRHVRCAACRAQAAAAQARYRTKRILEEAC